MLTSNFATKTELLGRTNRMVPGYWLIGIDYGFSAVKCFSPNKMFCFPNSAVHREDLGVIFRARDTDIILRDKDGYWIIGDKANAMMTSDDADNYAAEMYERNRYTSKLFGVIMKVGLGLALSGNGRRRYNNEEIIIQTGLPPKHKSKMGTDDTESVIEALAGDYDFELKIGQGEFQRYVFSVKPGNIYIMDQPMGSLISAITDNNGYQAREDLKVLTSSTLVFDAGFRTLDIYDIKGGMVNKDPNTFDNLGMYEVFSRVIRRLKKDHGATVTVPEMQKCLQDGYTVSYDRKSRSSNQIPLKDILAECSKEVCLAALDKLDSIYEMQHYDYLIVTGGTGTAWMDTIYEYYHNMTTLNIIQANCRDTNMPGIYSNVRGYYFYRLRVLDSLAQRG